MIQIVTIVLFSIAILITRSIDMSDRYGSKKPRKTAFNDPNKRKRTKKKLESHFKQDPNSFEGRIASFFSRKKKK